MKWRLWAFATAAGAAFGSGWGAVERGAWQGWVAIATSAWAAAALFLPPRRPRRLVVTERVCGCGDLDCRRGCSS